MCSYQYKTPGALMGIPGIIMTEKMLVVRIHAHPIYVTVTNPLPQICMASIFNDRILSESMASKWRCQNPVYGQSDLCQNPLYDMSSTCQNPIYDQLDPCQNPLYDMSHTCQNPIYDQSDPCQTLLYMSGTCQNAIMISQTLVRILCMLSQVLFKIPCMVSQILVRISRCACSDPWCFTLAGAV